jgi:hypothetical protein
LHAWRCAISGHNFTAGEVLTASTLNTYMVQPAGGTSGVRLAWGTGSISVTTGSGSTTITATGLTTVLAAFCADGNITTTSALPISAQNPSGNQFTARAGGNVSYTGSVAFFWFAIGT